MNCPVCGMEVNDAQFCPGCGANMSAFEGVSQDKVIVNQTPEQQMAAGDDSVTQLIPENYMNATGDDSVTQLIPENYMTSQGDDTATVMLDPSQVQQYMPNQQPAFAQQPVFNQAPYMNQTAPMNGYQQPVFNQGYQQGSGQMTGFGGAVKKVSAVSRGFGLASLILMAVLLVSCIIFMIKPLFYITQSYCGGIFSNEEVEEAIIEQDEDDYEEANKSAQILFGAVAVLVLMATLNAWSCFARLNNNCVKSPVNKAVGNFVFGLIGIAIFLVLKNKLDEIVSDGISYGPFSAEEAAMFNVYSLIFVLGIVSVVVNLINIFTAASAKKSVR